MPLYVLACLDKPDALERRLAARPAHLEHVAAFGAAVRLAGPLLDETGQTPQGSMFILEMDSADAVMAFHRADPYVAADVFGEISLHPFRVVVGTV